jgi:hypothetical protein
MAKKFSSGRTRQVYEFMRAHGREFDVRMMCRLLEAASAKIRRCDRRSGPTSVAGVAQAVYQSVDNPNDVTVTHDFHSLEQAKAFAASPELKSAMEKSGVKGAPQIWYTTKSTK